jgi:hypothetical protein
MQCGQASMWEGPSVGDQDLGSQPSPRRGRKRKAIRCIFKKARWGTSVLHCIEMEDDLMCERSGPPQAVINTDNVIQLTGLQDPNSYFRVQLKKSKKAFSLWLPPRHTKYDFLCLMYLKTWLNLSLHLFFLILFLFNGELITSVCVSS